MNSYANNTLLTMCRSKFGKILKANNYNDLLNLTNNKEILNYLKQNSWYSAYLENVNQSAEYRGNLEKLLLNAEQTEIINLCNFNERLGYNTLKFINILFDVKLVLCCCRYLISDNPDGFLEETIAYNKDNLLLNKLLSARKIEDLSSILENTYFKNVASVFSAKDFDYPLIEAKLYNIAYNSAYEAISDFNGQEKSEMENLISLYAEIKNLQMIYRHLNFTFDEFSVPQQYLIGHSRYLSKKTYQSLLNCKSKEEFLNIMEQTHYKRFKDKLPDYRLDIIVYKALYENAVKNLHFSKYPAVILFSYYIILESEYTDIATIIESKRYNLPTEQVDKILINNIKKE